jgi:hypothetical protein
MSYRTTADVVCAALLVGLSAAGCHDFETVGILAADAGMLVANVEAGDARMASASPADTGETLVTIDDCRVGSASNLDAGTIATLLAGGEGSSIKKWLYPYDGTVFPGGLTAPLLMWDDGGLTDDAVYVHMHSSSFDYRGCMKPTAQGQLAFPQQVWSIAGAGTAGAADPFTLEISVLSGGQVLGPSHEQIVIATGALTGSVYYMTIGVGLGSILRVQPGQTAQSVVQTVGCAGCHSVSADGSRLIAFVSGTGTSYALEPASSTAVALGSVPGSESPGLTPDGTLYVASAHPAGVSWKSYGGGVMTAGLYETMTGTMVPSSGIPTGAMVPAFSPDASLLVFNDFAIDSGKGLALMDFSETARAASNYRILFSGSSTGDAAFARFESAGEVYPAWPSFLPDGRALVFQLGAGADFSGGGTGILQSVTPGPQSDFFLVDTTTHAVTLLAKAMGFASAADASSNVTSLPFGIGEAHQNYGPSISPATSGGYAWMFFDSMRHYGNEGVLRQIWGAAIDFAPDGSYATDPSHPAFVLPGQLTGTGNFRAIAALGP